MDIKLSDIKLKLIEELGIRNEKFGMQPAPSRVLALLMICDQDELTFEEIYETLNISKSAGSNAINLLLDTHRIEYITRPGERKRYFRIKIKSLKEGIQKNWKEIEEYSSLLKQVIASQTIETKKFSEGLAEVVGFLDFMNDELPILFQKWENQKK
jgi:DNA-binding transcriptional regulator GbsR (MarR family)